MKLSVIQIGTLLAGLDALEFFPQNPETRKVIAKVLAARINPQHLNAFIELTVAQIAKYSGVRPLLDLYADHFGGLPASSPSVQELYGPPPVFACESCGDTGVLMGKEHGGFGLCGCAAASTSHARECVQRWQNRRAGVNTDAPEVVS